MVGLLDLLTPADASFGWLYVAPVVMMGWAYGWRGAVFLAALASATELLVDSPIFRESEIGEPRAILAWNALSSFLAFAVAGVVTDRFYSERERWKTVSAERTRLLRLLEREFPRPLRAIDWFARTFEEAVDPRVPIPAKMREQFSGLRHHSRELRFLATDLLRIGRLGSDARGLARTRERSQARHPHAVLRVARPAHAAGSPGACGRRRGLRAQPDRPDTRFRAGARPGRRPDPRAARHRARRQDVSARRARRCPGARGHSEHETDEPISGDRDRDHLGRGHRPRGRLRITRALPEDIE